MPTPYEILGVSPSASEDEIKKAFKKLAMIHHPDKGGDADKYRLVNLAYQVLKDPENRKKYNDALATTFNQFKEEDRDTKYYLNTNFLKMDPTQGGTVFDLEKFLAEFENSRKETFLKPVQEKTVGVRLENLLADRLAARDQELNKFVSTQKTTLKDPKNDPELFNHVFSQYKSRYSKHLEEVACDELVATDVNYEENPQLIEQIIAETQTITSKTTESKADPQWLKQQAELQLTDRSQFVPNYECTIDDSNKPVIS